jgi:hypothetical protein
VPPHELKEKDKVLEGFQWYIKYKPLKDDVMHYDADKAKQLQENAEKETEKEEITIKKRRRNTRHK